jgi:hypothetical protein
MSKYIVTLEDGRTIAVNTDDGEAAAKKQANHQEITRRVIAERQGHPTGPDPALAISAEKVSD